MRQTLPFRVIESALVILSFVATARAGDAGSAFTSGNATLRYYTIGRSSPVPLVVVTGGPGFDHGYIRIGGPWATIAKQKQVVFYDQRGTGKASQVASGTQLTVADFIADIEALRATLGIERISLLGHSWGGHLAMAYAARHPNRVEKLILVAAAAPRLSETKFLFSDVFPEHQERWRAWTAAMRRGDEAFTNQHADAYFNMLFHSPAKRDAWISRARHLQFNPHLASRLWSAEAAPDVTEAVAKLEIPALVIHGRHDMNVATETAYRTANLLRRAKLVVFEESGHLPFFEEPRKFADAVLAFLR